MIRHRVLFSYSAASAYKSSLLVSAGGRTVNFVDIFLSQCMMTKVKSGSVHITSIHYRCQF
jgi:hypothetical protein